MHLKFRLLLICGLAFLSACNHNLVSLDYTNAKDEVPPLTNLVFRFDKSLVNDSLTNQWDSTRYISFEPAIPGKFRWEHGDELVFSPTAPLSPATNYKATLNSDILQYSKYDRFSQCGRDPVSYARLKTGKYQWPLGPSGRANSNAYFRKWISISTIPSIRLHLKEKMKISVDGKPAAYALQTLSPSAKISIRLSRDQNGG